MTGLVWALVFGIFFFTFGDDVNWAPWFFASVACVSIFGFWLKNRLPLQAVALIVYILLNGVVVFAFRPFTDSADTFKMASLRLLGAHACLEFMFMLSLFLFLWDKIRRPMGDALLWVGLVHAIYMLVNLSGFNLPMFFENKNFVGLLGNKSIGATFSVVWVFFVGHWLKAWDFKKISLIAIGVLAVLFARSSISYVGLLCGALAYVWLEVKDRSMRGLLLASFIGLFFLGPYLKPQFFWHLSRYDAWPMFYDYLDRSVNLLFGGGLGTFKFYGPQAQLSNSFLVELKNGSWSGQWWLWAHNDWLQIVLELGFFGLFLSVIFYFSLLRWTIGKPFLFAAIVAYGVTMVGNYNLHLATTGLIGWWLVAESMGGENGLTGSV